MALRLVPAILLAAESETVADDDSKRSMDITGVPGTRAALPAAAMSPAAASGSLSTVALVTLARTAAPNGVAASNAAVSCSFVALLFVIPIAFLLPLVFLLFFPSFVPCPFLMPSFLSTSAMRRRARSGRPSRSRRRAKRLTHHARTIGGGGGISVSFLLFSFSFLSFSPPPVREAVSKASVLAVSPRVSRMPMRDASRALLWAIEAGSIEATSSRMARAATPSPRSRRSCALSRRGRRVFEETEEGRGDVDEEDVMKSSRRRSASTTRPSAAKADACRSTGASSRRRFAFFEASSSALTLAPTSFAKATRPLDK
mmetsp:Transcript_11993/g.21505  ORF Transcript_11993/g.21505 Transcript_11993/m.21505 type:complete len:315 (-) Transcript_11993:439-1383(-)